MTAKIMDLESLKKEIEADKEAGELIVFTNGCFDILHVGHIRYLKKAASLGDKLVLALNSDSSVKKLKGKARPFVPDSERMEMLAALEMIDYLILFSEIDASQLLEELKPQIYVKGGDYRIEDLPEAETVYNYGGKIVLVTEIKGKSTTNIIKKIRQSKDEK
ncbi:rfaE bifunctional protein nucleotidyltransferase chain/domain [Halanaerobium saccharolyticum]|uniref:D-glycero-beta-D-manno-heptose 1-phosphate adenylyltransferase n=1 Tax=Halanaerobium saccharolyticum TaxID=43595 RepID=A0A4R7Z717_9FIRM|nr:D-glycero-beta-D-manno-heptose 1-phosphate adenylyltransferase [Halanaerobium saccharolyticum]RAK09771.1 rfaE bifunctional protein nucleotidyltransferase chain/domain [Halanaerobium saccharolyticum]TDW07333.1 rfaE bifunctional protein nucleotidyltransferase chain/domain [Halanaerobium saccharolyticum]TDX61212.1 rfaE bifunctional protein nucleotidyltransferase chain/domain [Halanaerobium saccharolyticum]